jgi:hypothetical protein
MNKQLTLTAAILVSLHAPLAMADHTAIGVGSGVASPINTESGMTLPQGKWNIGLRSELVKFDEFSDAKLAALRTADPDADLHSVGSILGVSVGAFYGITDDLMVGVRIPYVKRSGIREPHLEGTDVEIEPVPNPSGLGDISIFGQYRFFQTDNQHASVILGLKTPTGKDDEVGHTPAEKAETPLQPGSGSWDGLFGLSYTQISGPYSFDASMLYSLSGEGDQDTVVGDAFSYNLAVSYRLGGDAAPVFYAERSQSAIDLILELNGEWRDKEETGSEKNGNSGGNVVYLSPGVRFSSASNWSLSGSVGVPVVNNFYGDQVEPDYRVITALNIGF